MATKAKTSQMQTYRQLINRSKEEIDSDQQEINIQHAENDLEIGINNVYGQLITAQGNLKKNLTNISKAEQRLVDTTARYPLCVQDILDARTNLLQQKANIEAEEARVKSIKETHEYLEELKSVLFPG